MFCNACGAPLAPEQVACAKCGQPVAAATSAAGRVARHGQMLGILWIVYSCLTLLVGSMMIFIVERLLPVIVRYQQPQQSGPPPEVIVALLQPILHVVVVIILIKGAAGIIAGIGLLQRAGWSRILAVVVGCISLLSFPFGTAIGVYSLWVLLGPASEAEFRQFAEAGAR